MNMEEKKGYILGIDQGGTKTAAAVMREDGFIMGNAVAKGAYFPVDGMETAIARIREAVDGALQSAAASQEDVSFTMAGITGVDWPGDDLTVKKALQERLSLGEVSVCNDAVIALYSGTMRSHGVVICAGTGMNGALIDREGRQFVYGDYMEERAQGGSALAVRAVRKVFDAALGLCEPTLLTKLFLEQAKEPDVDALLRRYMKEERFREELRFLVPQIMMTAERGDKEACRLLDEFAGEIVSYIAAGVKKMSMKPEEEEVILAGSVFKGADNPLTRRVVSGIGERLCGIKVVRARYEPVVGACIMGMIRMGLKPLERENVIGESAAVLELLCV